MTKAAFSWFGFGIKIPRAFFTGFCCLMCGWSFYCWNSVNISNCIIKCIQIKFSCFCCTFKLFFYKILQEPNRSSTFIWHNCPTLHLYHSLCVVHVYCNLGTVETASGAPSTIKDEVKDSIVFKTILVSVIVDVVEGNANVLHGKVGGSRDASDDGLSHCLIES